MRTRCLLVSTASAVVVLFLALPRSGDTAGAVPSVLVVSDLGEYGADLARMQSLGWSVTERRALEVEFPGTQYDGGIAGCDVVWIPANASTKTVRYLCRDGGAVDAFLRRGGVVVLMDVTPDEPLVDVGPGGADGLPLPPVGAGPVTIGDATHPAIWGLGVGGVPVMDEDLDPQLTSGRGCVMPPAGAKATVIARNAAGPVLVEYSHGTGRVIACALLGERENCRDNMLRYVASIAR